MNSRIFNGFRDIIYQSSGICLTEDKIHLLSNRIFKRMRVLGLDDPAKYLQLVKDDASGEELTSLLNAISTNVTHFFREAEHFDRLNQILAEHEASKKKELRIWCAAASTGEEPYTLAITVAEALDLAAIDFKLLGTDINIEVLQKAKRGIYTDAQVTKIPPYLRTRYFLKQKEGSELVWAIKPELQHYMRFSQLNLVNFPYPLKNPVDIIFCRNVLIYFDIETREKVINELARNLVPEGYLFLSRSENMLGIKHEFECLSGSVYRKRK